MCLVLETSEEKMKCKASNSTITQAVDACKDSKSSEEALAIKIKNQNYRTHGGKMSLCHCCCCRHNTIWKIERTIALIATNIIIAIVHAHATLTRTIDR